MHCISLAYCLHSRLAGCGMWRQFKRVWMFGFCCCCGESEEVDIRKTRAEEPRCGLRLAWLWRSGKGGQLSLPRLARTLFNVDPASKMQNIRFIHSSPEFGKLCSRPPNLKLFYKYDCMPHWQCLRVPSTSALVESTPHQETGRHSSVLACSKKAPV